jgi:hypothetical protein
MISPIIRTSMTNAKHKQLIHGKKTEVKTNT